MFNEIYYFYFGEFDMKITFEDRKKGLVALLPETLDDLWHLSHIIAEGDEVFSKTTRRIQDNTGDKLRSDRGVKKTFTLGISVESVSFHIFTGKLRIIGSIIRGPEDLVPLGSHHTIEAKLNTSIRIKKEHWSNYAIKRINQAIESSKKLSAMIVVLEDDEAFFGLMRQYGLEYYGPVVGNISGKRIVDKNRGKDVEKFYRNVADYILKFKDVKAIVLAGPGFVKNDFYKYLQSHYPDIAKNSVLEATGSGGRVGISEVLRKGTVEKLATENRVAFEIAAVNDLLGEISKSSKLVVYGKKDVMDAINMGAVEKLLVLDNLIRSDDLEDSMDRVENMSGEVLVVSSEHDGGAQLKSLGGLAAFLRYPIV